MSDGMDAALLGMFEDQWAPTSLPAPGAGDTDPASWPAGGGLLGIRVMIAPGANPNADPATYGWVTVSSYVQYDNKVVVKRGKGNEQGQAEPATTRARLRNPLGRFSPRNLNGPYWGALRRNTPIRVQLNWGTGWHTRYTGYIPNWQPQQDITGNYRYIDVGAVGVLGRLGQGKSPVRSALYRTLLALVVAGGASAPAAWWPMEDGKDSTAAVSEINGVPSLAVAGGVTFGANGLLPAGSAGAADISASGSALSGHTGLTGGAATSWEVEVSYGWTTLPADGVIPRVLALITPGPGQAGGFNYRFWGLRLTQDGGTGPWYLKAEAVDYAGTGTIFGSTVSTVPNLQAGVSQHARFRVSQNGTGLTTQLWVDGQTLGPVAFVLTDLYQPTEIEFTPEPGASVDYQPDSVSHVAIWSPARSGTTTTYQATGGYVGESATARFARLCSEDGVTSSVPTATASQAMGAQTPGTLLDLLRTCELAAEGVMSERVDGSLGLDPPRLWGNQSAALTLSWSGHDLVGTPALVDDDLLVHNDVTVTRVGGATRRVVDSTSAVGTGSGGIGTYDEGQDETLNTDVQALQHASWRRGVGTVDEQRLPAVRLHLTRTPALIDQWAHCDIGSRVVINGMPAYDTDGNPADQIIVGYTETIDQKEWFVDLNLAPELPYENSRIGKTDTATNRSRIACSSGSTTVDAPGVSASATSIPITSRTVRWIDSATYPTYFPFDIVIDGERMTVTALTTAALSQTLTVTRAVGGVGKAISGGATVTLFRTPRIAL